MSARGSATPARVFLGLGANVGNREANLRLALRWLAARCKIVAVSSLYGSAAVVLEGAPAGPDFVNAVCEITTDLSPEELLRFVKRVEHDIGRRLTERWAPRPIDIDILLYGDTIVDIDVPEGRLTIPHPLLPERNFVLAPLAELASDVEHPAVGRTIGELAEDIDYDGLTHVCGPGWVDGDAAGGAERDRGEDELEEAE